VRIVRQNPTDTWSQLGLALILGGAVGNYIDRLTRGFVVDFLEAHWFDKATWPSFNIADSAICIGAALILIDSFRREKKAKRSQIAASL
jgi:signal peptidase II